MTFNIVVCGGTFDHFHKGHASFLSFILSLSNKIILGLTTEKYVRNKKLSNSIENYSKRKSSIEEFFRKENALDRLEIEPIGNLFIPKKWESLLIDAIVVSSDTRKGAAIINKDREKKGLSRLKVIIAPKIIADSNKELSSFRIRSGEINREGKLYVNPLWLKRDLKLSENLRGEFQKPFGVLISEVKDSGDLAEIVATVGDVTTKKFNEFKFNQQISVIDFKVERQKRFSDIYELGFVGSEKIIKVSNPAGSITSDLFKTCLTIWNKGKVILSIEGEEDLAVLPLVLTAPLGAAIFYGQPPLRYVHEAERSFAGQAGIVKVVVSEESKDRAYNLTSKLKLS